MPPSGYSQTQANYIREFLSSCAKALHAEAIENGETLIAALDRELADISRYSRISSINKTQAATLDLTFSFYVKVREYSPRTDDQYWDATTKAASSVCREILAVKIPVKPIPLASARSVS